MFEIEVTDPVRYAEYRDRAAMVLAKHSGEFIIRRAPIEVLEGSTPATGMRYFVLRFRDHFDARRFYFSDEYQSVLPLRLNSSRSRAFLVEGVDDELERL